MEPVEIGLSSKHAITYVELVGFVDAVNLVLFSRRDRNHVIEIYASFLNSLDVSEYFDSVLLLLGHGNFKFTEVVFRNVVIFFFASDDAKALLLWLYLCFAKLQMILTFRILLIPVVIIILFLFCFL